MSYKTVRQQGQELLAAGRYDELQAVLSAERARLSIELRQALPYIPCYLPRCLVVVYARLLRACPVPWANHWPSLLQEEARLANQTRRLETIIDMERQLLAALNQEAKTLLAAGLLARDHDKGG